GLPGHARRRVLGRDRDAARGGRARGRRTVADPPLRDARREPRRRTIVPAASGRGCAAHLTPRWARARPRSIADMDLPAAGSGVRELRGPLFIAAAVVIVTVGIALARGLLELLTFSALASIVARRAQFWLLARGLPPWAALIVTVGGFILILVVMAAPVVASIAAFASRLGEDSAQVQDWIDQAQAVWGTVTGVPAG